MTIALTVHVVERWRERIDPGLSFAEATDRLRAALPSAIRLSRRNRLGHHLLLLPDPGAVLVCKSGTDTLVAVTVLALERIDESDGVGNTLEPRVEVEAIAEARDVLGAAARDEVEVRISVEATRARERERGKTERHRLSLTNSTAAPRAALREALRYIMGHIDDVAAGEVLSRIGQIDPAFVRADFIEGP